MVVAIVVVVECVRVFAGGWSAAMVGFPPPHHVAFALSPPLRVSVCGGRRRGHLRAGRRNRLCLHGYSGLSVGNPLVLHGDATYNAGHPNGRFLFRRCAD